VNDDEKTELMMSVTKIVHSATARIGEAMADSSEHGQMLLTGNDHDGRKWRVVLATNDAADRLEQWYRQEEKDRHEAGRSAGVVYRSYGIAP